MINATAILLLLLSAASVACQKQKIEWKGTIEEKSGVVVINNPKEPMYGEDVFVLEEELSIGEAGQGEEYMFSEVRSLAADDEGRIYVLDSKEKHIKVFDKEGKHIKTFGKEGQGPGEIGIPRSVAVTAQREVVVPDISNRRLTFFSLDGGYLRSISTAKLYLMSTMIDSKGNIISVELISEGDNPRYELQKFDSELNYLHSFGSSPTPNWRRDGFNPFFPVFKWSLTKDDQIVFGYPVKYEINIFDSDGNLIRKITKDYDPVEVAKEEAEEATEDIPPTIKKNLSIPKHYPAFGWLTTDDEGRIFIMTWERMPEKEGYYCDAFDAEGKYIAKIPLKIRPSLLAKKKLYAVEENEEGYHLVKRYKVIWKIGP